MKVTNKTIETIGDNNFSRIIRGSAISIIITIILLIIFALVLAYSNVSEAVVTPIVITISGISILIGGIISSIKIKKRGLVNGGIVGLVYIATIYFLSSIIDKDFSLDTSSIVMSLTSILTGAIRWYYWSKYKKKNIILAFSSSLC